eukprot:758242-Hanusia_phi.AAC.8
MDPELRHRRLVVVHAGNCAQEALQHLAEVPQVEEVVRFARGGEELLADGGVDVDGRGRDGVAQALDLVLEVHELAGKRQREDPLQLGVCWEGDVEEVGAALQAHSDDGSTAAGVGHDLQELDVLDVLDALLLAVVPEAIVEPVAEELEGRLRTEGVLGRHVEVVDEQDHLLASGGTKHVLHPLLHAPLDDELEPLGGRLGGEVDLREEEARELGDALLHNHCLAHPRVAHHQHVLVGSHELVGQEGEADGVDGGDEDLVEGKVVGCLPARGDLVVPGNPLRLLAIDEPVKDGRLRGKGRVELSHRHVELLPALLIDRRADGPHDRESEPHAQQLRRLLARLLQDAALIIGDGVEEVAEAADEVHLDGGDRLSQVPTVKLEERVDEEVEEVLQLRHMRLERELLQPGGNEGTPSKVRRVEVDHASARDGGWGGNSEVLYLEEEGDLRRHRDPLARHQREQLVVVQHRVHRLDPAGKASVNRLSLPRPLPEMRTGRGEKGERRKEGGETGGEEEGGGGGREGEVEEKEERRTEGEKGQTPHQPLEHGRFF